MVEVVPGGVSCRHEERVQGGRSSRDTPRVFGDLYYSTWCISGSGCVTGGGVLLHDGVVVVVVVRVLSLGQECWRVVGCCSTMDVCVWGGGDGGCGCTGAVTGSGCAGTVGGGGGCRWFKQTLFHM